MSGCKNCGSNIGFYKDDDGYSYCGCCNSQLDDVLDHAADDGRVGPANTNVPEPIELGSKVKFTASQFLDHPSTLDHPNIEDVMYDGVGPTEPSDFASLQKNYSYEDYYTEIRSRYVMGFQLMIQLQSRALVEKFNVSPLIIGLVGPLWLRFLASTNILADEWADQAVHDSEAWRQGETEEFTPSNSYRKEPVNIYGKRLVYIWCRSLRNALPISCSLALSLLACHVAREPILSTDILKWALEGKLPYFSAFLEIQKQLGSRTEACPIHVSRMFRPIQVISSQKLESVAANIAQKIGLKLPPVNFYAIASRYLRQLSLPTGKLLSSACQIHDWSIPSELYLSTNEGRIPTRACVMSILIVAIRNLFDINGYGIWESSFSSPRRSSSRVFNEDNESRRHLDMIENAVDDSKPSNTEDHRLSVLELLQILDTKYYELTDTHEYSRDLPTYLKYCKDVVFSGLKPSFANVEVNKDETELIDELWAFYQDNKGASIPDENERSNDNLERRKDEVGTRDDQSRCSTSRKGDESIYGDRCSKCSTDSYNCCHYDHQDSVCCSEAPKGSREEKALRQLKLDMEENQFCYIPPRVRVKRRDYVHYARKRKGMLMYAVHADYYILLRCCAKVALVETRIMHIAVLNLERRLQWLEKKIDHSLLLHSNLDSGCDFCEGDEQNAGIDPIVSNI